MKPVNLLGALHMPCLVAVAVIAAGASIAVAGAAEIKDAAVAGVNSGPGKVSKEMATKNALLALPGKVTDVTVEKKHGKNVWVIEVVADKDGAETDVLVDMDSGGVIGMEH